MDLLGPLVLAVGFSADAFAVSVCKGLSMKKATWRAGMICGLWFGGFQALMPVIGYYLGRLFADAVLAVAPIISFILLVLIGVNMLKEAWETEECQDCSNGDLSCKTMFVMAVATSIDAMAGGLSLALDVGRNINIFVTAGLIGGITFLFSTLGVKIGNLFGSRYEKGAQIAGGSILILYGVYILLGHLGVIG